MRFTKMQGCGNDYIYINCFEEKVENPEKLAIAMSERHFGVGSDGLVLIMPSETGDFRMRMFNLDGSEGKMCGNASRCVGKYVYERGLTDKTLVALETLGGMKYLDLHVEDGIVKSGNVLKVDSFLNHQMDVELFDAIGAEYVTGYTSTILWWCLICVAWSVINGSRTIHSTSISGYMPIVRIFLKS